MYKDIFSNTFEIWTVLCDPTEIAKSFLLKSSSFWV